METKVLVGYAKLKAGKMSSLPCLQLLHTYASVSSPLSYSRF